VKTPPPRVARETHSEKQAPPAFECATKRKPT
jgi:hypothetical protein